MILDFRLFERNCAYPSYHSSLAPARAMRGATMLSGCRKNGPDDQFVFCPHGVEDESFLHARVEVRDVVQPQIYSALSGLLADPSNRFVVASNRLGPSSWI